MTICEQIKKENPLITDDFFMEKIIVRNDSDEKGEYLAEWNLNISKYPIPNGLKITQKESNDAINTRYN